MNQLLWPFSKDNGFYAEANSMNKQHGIITFLAFTGIFILSILSSVLLNILFKSGNVHPSKTTTELSLFVFLIFWVWLYVSAVEKRTFRSMGFFGRKNFKNYFNGWLIGLSLTVLSALTISVITGTYPTFFTNFRISSIGAILIFFTIQGASEEIVFRGWFMQSLSIRHKPWIGILLSTLIFTVVHAANPNFSFLAATNILLIGFFLVLLILHDGNLWSACGFHTAWNFSMNSILGIHVSGAEIMGDSILKTNFSGNPAITGGQFGLEGSIVVTAAIALCCVTLLFQKNPIKK